MSRGRVFLVFLLLLLVGVGTWYWVAPRRAWERFTYGAAFLSQGDLAATVDFDAVRTNLRSDMTTAIRSRLTGGDGMAGIGASLVDAAVSQIGTVEGLAELFTQMAMGTTGPRPAFRYRSPSRVDVELRETPTSMGVLTMTRSGLSWRITRVLGNGFASNQEGRR